MSHVQEPPLLAGHDYRRGGGTPVDIADAVRAHAAADIVEGIATTLAAGGIPLATTPIAAAPTDPRVLVTVPPAIAVIVSPASPSASVTDIRAALRFPATFF